MPHDENNALLKAFGRLGIGIGFRRNAASFDSFTAAIEDPSATVEFGHIQEGLDGGEYGLSSDDHFRGYGETEDAAWAGLTKRFRQTSLNDTCVLIRTSANATGARYLAVKSDGADGVRNMGYAVTERTETGNRIREIALKRFLSSDRLPQSAGSRPLLSRSLKY